MSRLVASAFGIGFFPAAPGTAGSAAALLVGAALMSGPPWLLPLGTVLAVAAGYFAIRDGVADPNSDPGWVVIDEVAGQWVAMLGLAGISAAGLAAAFVGFRILDIWKPGPVGWADRQAGAFGIMADDILAGGGVALALYAARQVAVL